MDINLKIYGLTERFSQEAKLYPDLFLARITEQHRERYKAVSACGEVGAVVSGRLAYHTSDPTAFPAVGDWVMIDRQDGSGGDAVIHHVLSRRSVFTRQAAGTGQAGQVIAANIDTVFICMSLNADFNMRRLERYLTIAWDSMATPVIVLTKSDLCDDLQEKLRAIASVSMGAEVIACSSENGDGFFEISAFVKEGKTVAFVGSSGVGKSTLINRLMGEDVLKTSGIREDDAKGRHTTTHRQLLLLPNGGIVIDTPGMRELQIYTGNLSKTFEDIAEIAAQCRFADCSHGNEPGCAVRAAIQNGTLDEARFLSYEKLQREVSYEGLSARQLENEKISRMFGGKNEMKQFLKHVKNKKGN
ncbi:ribosome small subunit-dependent GTPase A [Christensenellaceae bacterium OttesenSCG-928-L17]|nr:ribosome small subunit-dependent GTPase A [Christensenellaceae bacterium OttesenSCG-928-L17]